MTDTPLPQPLEFHRDRFSLGGTFYLDECTVRAATSISATVPAGVEVQISGRWPLDWTLVLLARYFAERGEEASAVVPGADIDLPQLRLGDLPLTDVHLTLGAFLAPSGTLLAGSEFTARGTTTTPVSFHGWADPPQQIEAPTPRRVFRRILRDDAGQIVGTVEEVG
jgi:hypothetical protein